MNWNNLFTYDDGKLVWKVALGRKIRIGDPAGTMTPRGYITVTYQGKKYRAPPDHLGNAKGHHSCWDGS